MTVHFAGMADLQDQLDLYVKCVFEADDLVEIRGIKSGPTPHVYSRWCPAVAMPSLAAGLQAANGDGWNLYAGVNPRMVEGVRGDDSVSLVRCLFADFDGATVEEALHRCTAAGLPKPTLVISSGHGVHFYWRLTESIVDMKRFRRLQKRLAALLGSDPAVCNPERIMRLPGLLNLKRELPVPCRIVSADPTRRVSLADIERCLPELPVGDPLRDGDGLGPSATEPADDDQLARATIHLRNVAPAVEGHHGDNRTFMTALELRDLGLSPDQAFQEMQSWNLACQPPWTEMELREKIDNAFKYAKWPPQPHAMKPTVMLPGGSTPITKCASEIGDLMAMTGRYFTRGRAVVTVRQEDDGSPVLEPVRPAAFASDIESVANLVAMVKNRQVRAICTEAKAKLILASEAFSGALPQIRVVSRCPVLIERDGGLVAVCGYDPVSGVLAAGEPVPEMPLDEAKQLLDELLADFNCATEGDRARALAAIITPALQMGDLLPGRACVDLSEADALQAGKGYRNKLKAAIYRDIVRTVTQKKGGVGSLEESVSAVLVRGSLFLSLDNVRGQIDSPTVESLLTEDTFLARVPYQQAMEIDPRRVTLMLTSNKAEITRDLANRSSCVRIRKQPPGYRYRQYAEGDILEHVRANQPKYLGAVFAVIRAWHARGKLRTTETRHDFRPWCQTLDWICQNVLGTVPIMDGHQGIQQRMTSPVLNWLRDVALAVVKSGRTEQWLQASDLLEVLLVQPLGMVIPGYTLGSDTEDTHVRTKVLQAMGRQLALCFQDSDTVILDDIRIERRPAPDKAGREVRRYCFTGSEGASCAKARF